MRRILVLAYGLVAYAVFLVTFLYAIGFVTGLVVPKTVDTGTETALVPAILINVALLGLFAVQHSGMARPGFKRLWTRIVPRPIERSTYVIATAVVFGLLFWQWRPLPTVVWDLEHPAAETAVWTVGALGWILALIATFVIDHFELFGLRQVLHYARGKPHPQPRFQENFLYNRVRHPLMLGFLIAFWGTPYMTQGHLLLAAVVTTYILVAVQVEERDLVASHGEAYRDYRRRVPMLLPRLKASTRRTMEGAPAQALRGSPSSE